MIYCYVIYIYTFYSPCRLLHSPSPIPQRFYVYTESRFLRRFRLGLTRSLLSFKDELGATEKRLKNRLQAKGPRSSLTLCIYVGIIIIIFFNNKKGRPHLYRRAYLSPTKKVVLAVIFSLKEELSKHSAGAASRSMQQLEHWTGMENILTSCTALGSIDAKRRTRSQIKSTSHFKRNKMKK